MNYLSSLFFLIILGVGIGFFAKNVKKIIRNIKLGKDINRSDRSSDRWKNMLLVAFGQKKMFTRPIPAVLHFVLYSAFIITQIELVEIFIDGIFGTHRFFKPALGGFYTFLISFIEILSVTALVATVAFLMRRNLLKLPRLNKTELLGWPKKDANLILIMEIVLVSCIFTMNGTDQVLYTMGKSHFEGQGSFGFTVSQYLGPAFFGSLSEGTLHILERIGWWGHFMMVMVFLNYLYYSKHLHIILAFPNTFFADLNPLGKFDNLESVTNEVKLMMDPNADPYAAAPADAVPSKFGASDVTDLNWVQLLNAYTCTECGRCTSSCPANQTGKKLSPRKIMMDTRDRLTEVGDNINKNKGVFVEDGKTLLNDYITQEELWACTSCNACVEECPVNISPLSIIMDMRRYLVMEQSAAPQSLNAMMTNIENNSAPWQYSQMDRLNWKDEN
ncbi:(Fe-S)-binding protein [Flavobacterium columnare]|uniref:Iron-sulfur protein n=1 Tax=Flavobacterium columnare (strain ATCC 49512 / CIP 103533 / TG 44/87) TaxID=1041826 RepID=G8X618_FLACA|nr:(Fe-S)-binding protein [Flavobacterium columnare]AEW86248.1 iron-sulfur protein [Flavobacterium columnare ATCC 49512]ANO48547.1 iron-sulfur protein [Flavobacterium columnare]APT23403.1 Fe-S oxidoreductase [Flavobacterium columnare]MBF6655768.1 (Fe-S)-binding protein [Flavobacterium columnare]MBF6658622.1 (Fe-S)-binding protein [Flavobacterium columnare]